MKLFYSRLPNQAGIVWTEALATEEFLYYIFQDYLTTKQKGLENIDDYIEEMADTNEEKFTEKGFDQKEFYRINRQALDSITGKKLSELKLLGGSTEDLTTALEYLGKYTIEESAQNKILNKVTEETTGVDRDKLVKQGWGKDYDKYFDLVWKKGKVTEKTEKNTTTKTIKLKDPSTKIEGQPNFRVAKNKLEKLYDVGFTNVYKEEIGRGQSGWGDMKLSRSSASSMKFGTKIELATNKSGEKRKKTVIDLMDLGGDFKDKVMPERKLTYATEKTEGGGKGKLMLKDWDYESADLEYILTRAVFFANEITESEESHPFKEEIAPFKQPVKDMKKKFKRFNEINDDVEEIVKLADKGLKLNTKDLARIQSVIIINLAALSKYGANYTPKAYKETKEQTEEANRYKDESLNIKTQHDTSKLVYSHPFNAASEKFSDNKFPKELKGAELKRYKEDNLEEFDYDLQQVLSFIVLATDELTLEAITDLQKIGQELHKQMDKESGTFVQQDLKAKKIWNDPKSWLREQLTEVLDDFLTLYTITLTLTESVENDKKQYSVKKWNIKANHSLQPELVQRGTNLQVPGGTTAPDRGKMRRRKPAIVASNITYKQKTIVNLFAKTINKKLDELEGVI